MNPEMEIHDHDEAITVYAEVWAWAKLASVFAEGVASGRYPDNQKLGEMLKDDWNLRIYEMSKALARWLKGKGKED